MARLNRRIAGVGPELELLGHGLLHVVGQGVVEGLEDVGAGDAVVPGLELRGRGEERGRRPGHLRRPVRLLVGGQVVEAHLGHQGGVAGDAVAL